MKAYSASLAWAVASVALSPTEADEARGSPAPDPPFLPPTHPIEPDATPPAHRPSATPSTEWTFHKTEDGSHPDGNEQALVWLMNRARSDPAAEGRFLASIDQSSVRSNYLGWQVDLVKMQEEFADIPPRPPAAFDRRIYEGSRLHSLDLIKRNAQDHNQQFERVAEAGFVSNGGYASVFSAARDPVHAHAGFNVDWGHDGGAGDGMQPDRGHRVGLMNIGSLPLTNVGIAMVPEGDPDTDRVGPLVTSIVYAAANTFGNRANHFNRFIVGTVWEDHNGNGIYDSGEGLGGVTVMPDRGAYYAITGAAGGFSIPVSENGAYTLNYFGGDLPAPEQRSVTVEGVSVLARWRPEDAFGALGEAIPPDLAVTKSETGLTARWRGLGDHEYRLQRYVAGVGFVYDDRPITQRGGAYVFSLEDEEILSESALFRIVAERTPDEDPPSTSR